MSDQTLNSSPQRRDFFRRKTSLSLKVWLFALPDERQLRIDREIPVRLLDLSGGGAHLEVERPAEASELICIGAIVDLSIPAADQPLPIRALARVVRIKKPAEGALEFALEFILITQKEADAIVRLVSL